MLAEMVLGRFAQNWFINVSLHRLVDRLTTDDVDLIRIRIPILSLLRARSRADVTANGDLTALAASILCLVSSSLKTTDFMSSNTVASMFPMPVESQLFPLPKPFVLFDASFADAEAKDAVLRFRTGSRSHDEMAVQHPAPKIHLEKLANTQVEEGPVRQCAASGRQGMKMANSNPEMQNIHFVPSINCKEKA